MIIFSCHLYGTVRRKCMREIMIGDMKASEIAMGCMRIAEMGKKDVDTLIHTALDSGINFFDHADIYGGGRSEEVFGEALRMNPGLRDRIYIQSKCGIRKGCYDFSYEHIVGSVEGSLRRLGIETLDSLLFHRPDVLADSDEFCRAVRDLKASGKVRSFGVSNMNPAQIELLESWTGERMTSDQVQLSVMHAGLVTSGLNVNVPGREGTMFDGSLLPYAQRRGMTLQAWSPFQYGMFEGCFVGNEKFPEVNAKLSEIAERYGVTPGAVAVAWILRLPLSMQVVLGTTSNAHMQEACRASDISLTRKEWYEIYLSAGYLLP